MQDAGQVNVKHLGPFSGPNSASHDASPTQDALPGQTQPPICPILAGLKAQATSHPHLLPGGLIVNMLAEGAAIAVTLMLPIIIFPKDLSQLQGYSFMSFLLSIRIMLACSIPLILGPVFIDISQQAPGQVGIMGCIASYCALISMVPGICEGEFIYLRCHACCNLPLSQLAIR